jgi:hypothetical protein
MNAFLRTDFDEFLFAPIGQDASGMPLTLLSVLARLGLDPWEEAADLARLPAEPAMQRLAARLDAVPHGPAPGPDTVSLATRLIALLHRAPKPKVSAPAAQARQNVGKKSRRVNVAIYYLAGLILLLVAQWALASRQLQTPTDITLAPQPQQ